MAHKPAGSEWHNSIQACFRNRLSADKFLSALQAAEDKYSVLPPETLAKVLLDLGCRGKFVDPRLSLYLEALLDAKTLDSSVLLSALRKTIPDNVAVFQSSLLDNGSSTKPSLQTIVLQLLTRKIANGLIAEDVELFWFLKTLIPWMTDFPSSVMIGFLVSATLGCPTAQEILPRVKAKKLKTSFGQSLTPFIGNLSQTNIQLASALSYWQKHYQLHDEIPAESMDLLNGVDLGTLSFEQGVLDNEPLNTRAGLYIYLNAMLCERPLFDDVAVMNYLNIRYKGNIPTLVTDLILAAFDILANAMYRTEPAQSITILRSFLVNKLPPFLNNYAAIMFPPLTIEACISQALLRIDPAAFPSFSQMFDLLGKNGILSEARQEFLFACALHQLIPEGSIEGLLGDVPMQSLPASGRYVKNDLVAQCTANPTRIEELVAELENMEDADHPAAENQPVYDEFGSVLLLVSTIRHRFDLNLADLGIVNPKSFTAQYFRSACGSRAIETLTGHENDLLGGWIRGLFETEGIDDELMSMCKPAEFHLLVATLLDQSVKACQAKVLTLDILNGGFGYLLEPFLLPSLTAGLTYFAHTLWATSPSPPSNKNSLDTFLPALTTLLKPPSSMSPDTQALYTAVLTMVAEPLDKALTHAQRSQQKPRPDIPPLLDVLKGYTRHRHTANAYAEVEQWAQTPRGGLLSALAGSVHALVVWCLASSSSSTSSTAGNPTPSSSPPNYTHRLLRTCTALLGATPVLRALLDELVAQTSEDSGNQNHGDIAFDVVVSMLVAPTAVPASSSRLGLRECLRMEFAGVEELAKKDAERGRVLVRLWRRVETLVGGDGGAGLGQGVSLGAGGGVGEGGMVLGADGTGGEDIEVVLNGAEGGFGLGTGDGAGDMLMG
ncbi:MAG: hypothetical protein Q9219_000111 [cf. Caloplaca sp. 3 TL-2023]